MKKRYGLLLKIGKINLGTVDELDNGRVLYHMMTSPRRVFLGEKNKSRR